MVSRRTGSITIRDVASMAGVVPSTVSHVINNTAPVSEGTRRRVAEAIQKLGYRRNALASSLRQQMTMTIGLLVPNIAEPLHADFVRGVSEEAGAAGYGVILGHTGYDEQVEERQLARMLDRRVDGLIVVPEERRWPQAYDDVDVPMVIANRQRAHAAADPPSIDVDNRRAGKIAARHLLNLGHTRIGIITTAPDSERCQGFLAELEEAGVAVRDELIASVGASGADPIGQGRAGMQSLLAWGRPTACFVVDDARAIGAIEAIQEARMRVPTDVALVGCGDLHVAALTRPRLTTVGHPKRRLGIQAMRLLTALITDSSTPPHVTMPVSLVVRDTCGALLRPAHLAG